MRCRCLRESLTVLKQLEPILVEVERLRVTASGTILLIEDEVEIADLLRLYFEREGRDDWDDQEFQNLRPGADPIQVK